MSKAKKVKKPIDLPIGKAIANKDVDLSHVRLPIDTSVLGLKHVLTLFETATNEVKSYLAYECDLMYECRICRTIFRSIANFILHKRKYCRDKYNTPRDPEQKHQEADGVSIIQRDIETANQIIAETEVPGPKKVPGRCLNPIIENLLRRQEQKKLVETLKNENPGDLPKNENVKKAGDLRSISLEKIDGSEAAVFQTLEFGPKLGDTELMKSEVMEIHSIFDQNEAVINSRGEIISFNTKGKDKHILNKNDYLCTECNTKFTTKKTLSYHVKCRHSQSRLVYPCPLCKDHLSNTWSVYRHLLKVHRMTTHQIRKYRTQVHNSAICRKPEENKDKRKSPRESKDDENDWLDNVEGDSDLQMCGGCGKHFDRKAALISHSVMCTKRIAVCNSIKENNKKKEPDVKENAEKARSASCRPRVMGSAKRKSINVIMYKPKSFSEEIQSKKEEIEIKIEDHPEIKKGEQALSLILEENDINMENRNNDRINKDMEYDKDKLMSIIGVDTSVSNRSTPLFDKELSPSLSIRSDSPCRGFEDTRNISKDRKNFQKTDHSEDVILIAETKCDDLENEKTDNSGDNPPETETKKVTEIIKSDDSNSSSNSSTKTDNEMDISSDISLDNKINSDFKLDLQEDPNFVDVSIKPLIKEIIDEKVADLGTKDSLSDNNSKECMSHKVNGVIEKKTFKKKMDSEEYLTEENKLDNNNLTVCSSSSKKRKRSDSSNEDGIVKISVRKLSDLNESENKEFISKISSFVDRQNLKCSLCNTQFISLSELLHHMSNHFSWYRFQCSKCLFMSFSKKECEKHVRKDHELPFDNIQGTVLPIPTWKASLISDNFMHMEPGSDAEKKEIFMELVSKSEDLIDLDKKQETKVNDLEDSFIHVEPGSDAERREIFMQFISKSEDSIDLDKKREEREKVANDLETKNSNDLEETADSKDSSRLSFTRRESEIVGFIDLTIDEEDCIESDDVFQTTEETDAIQDLSKQAIMEVILGNHQEAVNKSVPGQSSEYVRPLRNRTRSIKASQKDFIYDYDTFKHTSFRAYCSRTNTEPIKPFEVQE